MFSRYLSLAGLLLGAAMLAACAQRVQPPPEPAPVPANTQPAAVAPQSGVVLPPSYPALGGPVIQSGTGSIPLVQGQ